MPQPSRILPLLLLPLTLQACGSGDPLPPEAEHSVTVAVTTTGEDPDPDGYQVTVGSETLELGESGSVVFDALPSGSYEVTITGVAPNCSVAGGATVPVSVADGRGARVDFVVECASVLATGAFTDVTCPGLTMASASALPLAVLDMGSVPDELEDPLYAYVTWSGGDDRSVSVVDRAEDGSIALVAPYHPSGSLDGGEVSIRVAGGTRACPAVSLEVEALPEAPGELEAVVGLLQDVVEIQAGLVGTTVDELRSLDGSVLPGAQMVPLLIAQSILDHPDNSDSLQDLVDGTASFLDGATVAEADRIVAGTGIRSELEALVADLQTSSQAAAPARIDALDCLVTEIDQAQELHDCMELSTSAAFRLSGASAEVLGRISFAAGVAGAVPHPAMRVGSAAVGGIIFAFQKLREGTANLLPSELVSMELEADPLVFLEDEPGPGTWSATVGAASQGWELDRSVLETLAQVAGASGAYRDWLERFVPDRAFDLAGIVVNEVVGRAIGASGDVMVLYIPPETYGPIDVSPVDWTDRNIVPEVAIVGDGHNGYQPSEPGTSVLSVRTEDGMFGGQQITAQQELEVRAIQMFITPDDVTLAPSQVDTFEVTVVDALHPDSVEIHPDVTLQGSAVISYDGDGKHSVIYTAPAQPDPNSTDLLVVRHTARGGARAGGDPLTSDAVIHFPELDLQGLGCTDPGEEVRLRWTVTGLDDPALDWSASAGDVDDNGVFTAPDQEGEVTISVTLADNPAIGDQITVQVGGCSCQGAINVGGSSTTVTGLRFYLSADLSGVQAFDWAGENFSQGTFGFGTDPIASQVIPFGSTGSYEALTSGAINGVTYLNPEDPGDPVVPPLSLSVDENTGTVFAGSVAGSVRIASGPDWETVSLSMTFRIEADPTLSDDDLKVCEVPVG